MYNVSNTLKKTPKLEAQKAKAAGDKLSYAFCQASVKFRKQKIPKRLYRSTWEILEQDIAVMINKTNKVR